MSLTYPQMLGALGLAQAAKIAPALVSSYAGGDAGTVAMVLLLLAQDAVTLAERTTRETAAMAELLGETGDHATLLARLAARHAEIDGSGDPLERRILAFYVAMADAAYLEPPAAS